MMSLYDSDIGAPGEFNSNKKNKRAAKILDKLAKKTIKKYPISPILSLKTDDNKFIDKRFIYSINCEITHSDNKISNYLFSFNIIEVMRQFIVSKCLINNHIYNNREAKILSNYNFIFNPITQEMFTYQEIQEMKNIFIQTIKELHQEEINKHKKIKDKITDPDYVVEKVSVVGKSAGALGIVTGALGSTVVSPILSGIAVSVGFLVAGYNVGKSVIKLKHNYVNHSDTQTWRSEILNIISAINGKIPSIKYIVDSDGKKIIDKTNIQPKKPFGNSLIRNLSMIFIDKYIQHLTPVDHQDYFDIDLNMQIVEIQTLNQKKISFKKNDLSKPLQDNPFCLECNCRLKSKIKKLRGAISLLSIKSNKKTSQSTSNPLTGGSNIYNYIINPYTGNKVSIFGNTGKNILNNYINAIS
tara:strand:+ start:1 stop:1239 length:1239 start_codon:yes stop_codon:yes gene_type:complete